MDRLVTYIESQLKHFNITSEQVVIHNHYGTFKMLEITTKRQTIVIDMHLINEHYPAQSLMTLFSIFSKHKETDRQLKQLSFLCLRELMRLNH